MKYTNYLHFPSGRSVSRVKQDIKTHKLDPNVAARNNGIAMPWRAALDYLKDKSQLSMNNSVTDLCDLESLIPDPGRISLMLGMPEGCVPQSLAKLMMLSSRLLDTEQFGYCDFAIKKKNGAPRAVHFMQHVDAGVYDRDVLKEVTDRDRELKRYESQWDKIFQFVGSNTEKFKSGRLPRNLKINHNKPSIVFSMNPRKMAIADLMRIQPASRLVIADSQAKNVYAMNSVDHFSQHRTRQCSLDRRVMLGNTQTISEQRAVLIGGDPLVLRRFVTLSDDQRRAFIDPREPMLEVMDEIANAFPSWEKVATQYIDNFDADMHERDVLTSKAMQWDVLSGVVTSEQEAAARL